MCLGCKCLGCKLSLFIVNICGINSCVMVIIHSSFITFPINYDEDLFTLKLDYFYVRFFLKDKVMV